MIRPECMDAYPTIRKQGRPSSIQQTGLHPYEGDMVGYLGEVHPDVLDNYKIGEKAYVAVLDMPAVTPHTSFDRKYTGIAKYPAVSRDLSMVVPKNILWARSRR